MSYSVQRLDVPRVCNLVKLTRRLVILSRSCTSSLYGSSITTLGGSTRKMTWNHKQKTPTSSRRLSVLLFRDFVDLKFHMFNPGYWRQDGERLGDPPPRYSGAFSGQRQGRDPPRGPAGGALLLCVAGVHCRGGLPTLSIPLYPWPGIHSRAYINSFFK